MGPLFNTMTQYQQAKSQEKIAQYQANVAESNRKATLARGVEDENRLRKRNRIVEGSTRASLAEYGLFGGSAFDVLQETMITNELDAQTQRAGYQQQAQNLLAEKNVAIFNKKQAGLQARQILAKGAFDAGMMLAGASSGAGGASFDASYKKNAGFSAPGDTLGSKGYV